MSNSTPRPAAGALHAVRSACMDLAIATQPDPAAVRPGVRAAAVIHNCNLNFHNFFRFVSVRQKLKVPAFAKSHVYALFSWCVQLHEVGNQRPKSSRSATIKNLAHATWYKVFWNSLKGGVRSSNARFAVRVTFMSASFVAFASLSLLAAAALLRNFQSFGSERESRDDTANNSSSSWA